LALPAVTLRAEVQADDLADLSIEELANIQVTSVSKRPERLQDAAASVFVITADDIRRTGAATLPEVLRLAPNLYVARSSSHGYSISARGMNTSGNSVSNKLLVLVDGRSVYTPLFAGVFWDAQDLVLEDIERIEVVSGPGGVLWGLNAVNAVINISTRSARDTAGTLAAARVDTDGGGAVVRHGRAEGELAWRAFAQVSRHDNTELASGAPVNDSYRRWLAGMRADWARGPDRVTVNANLIRGRLEQPEPGALTVTGFDPRLGRIESDGANLTARWDRALEGGAGLSVQAYVDHTSRKVPPLFSERRTTADLQFQHTLAPWGAHSVVWGANVRHSRDRIDNGEIVAFLPARSSQRWASLFLQDEIALREDWRLTLGNRVEYNEYTGAEWLPSLRLSWRLSPHHALWSAASRTVRAPSRLDVDTYIPARPPHLLRGGPEVRGEVAKVFELGYRGQPLPELSWSLTLFHHDYDDLRTQEIDPSGTFITFASLMEGRSTGVEAWGGWQAARNWRLSAGFTAMHQSLRLKPGSNDINGPRMAERDPRHTWQLRSSLAIDDSRELDLMLRRVGATFGVDSYTALDARFGWRLRPGLALSVFGENLTGSHAEYGPVAYRTEIERRIGVKAVWEY
jgi:iron complex outermembrane receptor protein